MALAQAQLGNWEKAQENLVKALDYKTDAKLNIIDKALQSTLVSQSSGPKCILHIFIYFIQLFSKFICNHIHDKEQIVSFLQNCIFVSETQTF